MRGKCFFVACTSISDVYYEPVILLWPKGEAKASGPPAVLAPEGMLICSECKRHFTAEVLKEEIVDEEFQNKMRLHFITSGRKEPDFGRMDLVWERADYLSKAGH